MNRAEVDALTMVLFLPFCLWLGAWGILPPFFIGFFINVISDRAAYKAWAEKGWIHG